MSADAQPTSRLAWIVTIVAIVVASAPHLVFAPPLQLHMEGQMQAWLGIAVWAPAILAGVGFFFGVEFGRRGEGPHAGAAPPTRTAAIVVALVAYVSLVAMLHEPRWTGMASMRPWDQLQTTIPLFAALGALRAIFWQGFVQDRTLAGQSFGARIAILIAAELVVASPFLLSGDAGDVAQGLLPLVGAEALVAGLAFELGITVRGVIALRALMGIAFVWFQQALLL